jgi:hypothetical protein
MSEMKTYVIYRHLIDSPETWKEYRNDEERIIKTINSMQRKKTPIKFGVNLMVDKKELANHYGLASMIDKHLENSKRDFLTQNENQDTQSNLFNKIDERQGSGTAFRQILFSADPQVFNFEPSIVICADLDQYAPHYENDANNIHGFAQRMADDYSLYGIGTRTVPVQLALHPRNDRLRQICELYHALAFANGNGGLKIKDASVSRITPAYKNIGEFMPGFYAVNRGHGGFPALAARISRQKHLKGFAIESFAAFTAQNLGPIATGYVPSQPNRFYFDRGEKAEEEWAIGIIKKETEELIRAERTAGSPITPERSIYKRVKDVLENESYTARISEFFDGSEVERVREIMKNAVHTVGPLLTKKSWQSQTK